MKRKILSVLLILCLAMSMLLGMGAKPIEAEAATSFKIRTSMPKLNDPYAKWYYSDINRFYAAGRLAPDFVKYKGIMDDGVTSGYVWGNCTWWAYSRASEIMKEPLDPRVRGNAGAWYSANKNAKCYPYGSTPKVGAIVVYGTHVAFIEKIVNGQIYVSESGWQTKTYAPKSTDDFFFHYGIPWNRYERPQGYIYVTDKKSIEEETVKANFKVKVDVTDLILRAGPGTGYANLGKIKKGTYDICATSKDGRWGKLKSTGNWICLDYTTRVKDEDNNDLASLSVSGWTFKPSFDPNETDYNLTVNSTTSSVTINAKASESGAKVSGTGKVSLTKGKTKNHDITVTSESGKKKTYTIKLSRPEEYKVEVKVDSLNMRTGPSTSYASKGYLKPGIYTVIRTSGDWAKLETNGYWISMDYATKVAGSSAATDYDSTTDFNIKIKGKTLNMRTGPGTSYTKKGTIKADTVYTITATKNGWGKLSNNGYWVNLDYTNKITAYTTSSYDSTKDFKIKIKGKALNARIGPSTRYISKTKLKPNVVYTITATKNGWGKLKSNGYWINLDYTNKVSDSTSSGSSSSSKEYKVKVNVTELNMRTGPSTSYTSKGYIKKGTYTIVKTSNGWGKLKSNGYWIKLSYTEVVSDKASSSGSSYKVKVSVDSLNMRTGPSTAYTSKGKIKKGTYTIIQTNNGWGKLKTNGYWIKLSYTTKVS